MQQTSKAPARNLSDHVAGYLETYIRKRKLSSGEQIPSEVRVSRELNVSRSIVREAYRSLQTAGVLDTANGRTPRVGRLSNRSFARFLQHALSTDQASREHVFDVRQSLEVRAAELAALARTDEQARALAEEAAIMRAASGQRERCIRADVRFHEVLAEATGNPLFVLLGSALHECLEMTIRAGFHNRRLAGKLTRSGRIHADIARAVARRDPVGARRAMTAHFDEARVFVLGTAPKSSKSS